MKTRRTSQYYTPRSVYSKNRRYSSLQQSNLQRSRLGPLVVTYDATQTAHTWHLCRSQRDWKERLKTYWLQTIRACNGPSMKSVTSMDVVIVETLLIHVTIEDPTICMIFGAARNLAVPILVGISFNDGSVRSILPPGRNDVLYNAATVQIVAIVDNIEGNSREDKHGTEIF